MFSLFQVIHKKFRKKNLQNNLRIAAFFVHFFIEILNFFNLFIYFLFVTNQSVDIFKLLIFLNLFIFLLLLDNNFLANNYKKFSYNCLQINCDIFRFCIEF